MQRTKRESRILRVGVGTLSLVLALIMNGCQSAQPREAATSTAAVEATEQANEARGIADATLGKQSEILAQGELAHNGREQLLMVNRFATGAGSTSSPPEKGEPGGVGGNPSPVLITRAAILEKNGDKWSEVLLCDEHLKNPNGYLGGVPLERVAGWRLEFSQDARAGLEMSFTPSNDTALGTGSNGHVKGLRSVLVRWNQATKRYQSFDRLRAKYLPDLPALEAQPSTLK